MSDGEAEARELAVVTVVDVAAMPAYPEEGFLGRTLDDEETALAYYDAIDPAGERTTLAAFLARNRLDRNADAEAVFFNAGDLALGRRMSMRRTGEGVVMSVTNYANVDDAVDDRDEIATVSMEYTPGPAGGAPFTKFYVFGADGRRVTGADLDGGGFKHVPGLCISCHGGARKPLVAGAYPDAGDVGARFLPFDLEAFTFSDRRGFRRADQELELRELNRAVLETNASPATVELVHGWYGGAGLPGQVQDSSFVPAGWAGAEPLYLGAVARSCRTCHIRMEPPLDFASAAEFHALGLVTALQVAGERRMPEARVTFERFWASDQPALLLASLDAPVQPLEPSLPLSYRQVEAGLDQSADELVRARELSFELAFLRSETPARLPAEASALETATRDRLDRLRDERGAAAREAVALLEPRLLRLQREARDLSQLLTQRGAVAILAARDRFVADADRLLAQVARRGRQFDALSVLEQLRADRSATVDALVDVRDAIRDLELPVVESP